MLQLTCGIQPFMESLSMFFKHAPGWGVRRFRLHGRGRFDPALRALNYGLGNTWAMRHWDDKGALYVFVVTDMANNGVASVSYYDKDGASRQWKFTLQIATKKDQAKPVAVDFLTWIQSFPEDSLDMFADAQHKQAEEAFITWDERKPIIRQDLRTQARPVVAEEPEWFEKSDVHSYEMRDTNTQQFSISFRYKSPENRGYCVIVFDATAPTRNDRYAICVQAPSFMLTNAMALYQKALFGKLMRLICEEHRSKTSAPGNAAMSHLLEFTKMQRFKLQAVCVTQPQSLGVVDASIRPGQVFDIKAINKNMDEAEYITINVAGVDVDRNANNFVIYGRN